jgi:hypothetical protein
VELNRFYSSPSLPKIDYTRLRHAQPKAKRGAPARKNFEPLDAIS